MNKGFFFTEALVTLDVHSKDVLWNLCEEGLVSNADFKWLSQLRYYWQVTKKM